MDRRVIWWASLALIFQLGNSDEATGDGSSHKQQLSSKQESSCAIKKLDVGLGVTVQCFPEQDPTGFVTENTVCTINRNIQKKNGMVLKKCMNGKWTGNSLGPKRKHHKRGWFRKTWRQVKSGFQNAWCRLFDNCEEGDDYRPPPKTPPRFATPCRPSDINDTYLVESGQTSGVVNWSDPQATDTDGSIVSVTQNDGSPSGSQFKGDTSGKQHIISYLATDNDGLTANCHFTFIVKIQTCSEAEWPVNGRRYCSLFNYLGSVCTYTCNSGYEISSSSEITCQGSVVPAWSSSSPTCEKKICPSPPSLENGIVSCVNSTYEYLVTCQISCNIGYRLSGIDVAYTTCQADETWSNVKNAVCSDNVPPELSCKTPQIFYADRSSRYVTVEWTLPKVADNFDPNPTFNQTGGQPFGSDFQIGSSYITYTAKDNLDNESPECSIEIRVEETACQHPADTLEDNNMVYSCSGATYVYGIECTLSCSYNLPLLGSDLIVCERNDSSNNSDLSVGTWSWGSGEKPLCNHTDCPALDPPLNGAISPNFAGTTRIYTMLCNANYDIPSVGTRFTGMFYCQNDGTYVPSFDPPDCIVPRSPWGLRLPSELYYFSGDCNDQVTQDSIRNQTQEIFDTTVDSFLRAICPTTNNCTVSNLRVICGATSRKKRMASNLSKNTSTGSAFLNKNLGRQKRSTATVTLTFDFNMNVNPEMELLPQLSYVEELFNDNVKPGFQDLVDDGALDIDINGVSAGGSSFNTSAAVPGCLDGYRLLQLTCVPCPSGYYLNQSSICELCPLGYYSDEPALTSCKACPIGYSTIATGSKNEDKCLEICPAGKSSATGLVPCTVCRVGYYQSETGQTNCTQCTSGITEFAGSVSSTACQAFHLLIDNTGEDVTGTTLSTDLMALTFIVWVKPFVNLTANAQIKLKSGEYDVINLNLTDNIKVNIGSSFNKTVGSLTSTTWTHITVTWDTANTELSVYINGQLEVSDNTLTPQSSPLITDGSILLQSTGDTGVYIADLHLQDAVLSQSEIVSTTSSCWTESSGNVLGMRDFRGNTLTGVQLQTPSTCDPIDECATNPCNNHTCINGINTYTCFCSSGWSGLNCDTPPDYCIVNGCINGATCVLGQSGFTCICPSGYSGDLCEVAPVNGGWAEWTVWEPCTVTCNGGTQSRSRSCDNPEPSPLGINCSGNSTETITCGQDSCPTCPAQRGFKMLTNCTEDEVTGGETCKLYCRSGYILPSSLETGEYTCGFSTNFNWSPNNNPPNCERPGIPIRFRLIVNSDIDKKIADDDETEVKQSITDNLSGLQCVQDDLCIASLAISNSKRKRNSGSTISLTLTVEMTETGPLDIQDYIETSTISPSFQEVIDATTSLESAASYINTSSSSIFDVTVNGVTYTSSQSTLTFTGNITCPTGQTTTDGVCVSCPEGTYYIDDYCAYCAKGTYSSSSGQTSCTACPYGLSTTTVGSYALSQCTVSVKVTTPVSTTTERSDTDNTSSAYPGIYIGIAIAAVLIAVTLGVFGFIKYKKTTKKTARVASTDCLRSVPRLPSARTQMRLREVAFCDPPKKPVFRNPTTFEGAELGTFDNITPLYNSPHSLIYSFKEDEELNIHYDN